MQVFINTKLAERMTNVTRKPRARDKPMSPAQILSMVEQLIQWYQIRRSVNIALSITEHLEMLACHPDKVEVEADACEFERLSRKWRLISNV